MDFATTKYFDRIGARLNPVSFRVRYLIEVAINRLILRGTETELGGIRLMGHPYTFDEDPLHTHGQGLPEIEALIVVAGKDIETLGHSLKGLESGSRNGIVRTTVITRNQDLAACNAVINELNNALAFPIRVVSETSLISDSDRKLLIATFGDRFGWVLQQVLKVKFVEDSYSAGVLIVDADTALLHPRTWLNDQGVQTLLVSSERHHEYYAFLNRLGIGSLDPATTHVTHHMLMQPDILRSILKKGGLESVHSLTKYICGNGRSNEHAPFSIDYELYAQGLLQFEPKRATLAKFSNIGLPVQAKTQSQEIAAIASRIQSGSKYYSASFHSYLKLN